MGQLQQHLPFTVLKRVMKRDKITAPAVARLQQHLPFTVLKLYEFYTKHLARIFQVATAPTVYGIETQQAH